MESPDLQTSLPARLLGCLCVALLAALFWPAEDDRASEQVAAGVAAKTVR